MKRYRTNNTDMLSYPDRYDSAMRDWDWQDYHVCHGFQALYDSQFTTEFTAALRNQKVESIWPKDPDRKHSYLVSFDLGERTSNSSKLLNDDEFVEIVFQPRIYHDKKGKKMADVNGWEATNLEAPDDMPHSGDHLLRVTPPRGYDKGLFNACDK